MRQSYQNMSKMALVSSEIYIDCVVLANILTNRVDFKEPTHLMAVPLDPPRAVCMILETKLSLSSSFGRPSSEEAVSREVSVEGDTLQPPVR